MKLIKNWVINKLGGFTSDQVEETRVRCEAWAVDNLTAKEHSGYREEIIVIGSNEFISGNLTKTISIAPWCRDVRIEGMQCVED